ncbi:nuclear transport factor 2 family protein [Streptomyces clavuligerus]|uniref:SnoaL-like domain-containing protein n=1 Tax=Streptomyces clavuligerus TaxID=1901 RepID=D5SL74_STRCL|nr:nuclear transport factor 2 family protein [Streptomyces clavuligerus]ANW22542.1 hypothetical protein BB341_29990 [Streptomyces clavuligerus]AXU17429.1 nuclear transport factor 2 family protein [Streptomyces clavuligerus]EFG04667.1 Hypothetical protein SCLAV_p1181 [Streptomyces clavuligerus]MBY6306884.1 nuclear transport factor 2 family protein [Streptomyces clavuligerus]QCS10521.1 hypothetical protein CRV15_33850 [Streptomyces clavuligerus]
MSRRRIRSAFVVATAAALLPLGPLDPFEPLGSGAAVAAGPVAAACAPAPAVAPAARPLPANVAAFMEAYCAWGARPEVGTYMALFTGTGTLMDSGLPAPIGKDAIRAQMESLLLHIPDYRFRPRTVHASPDGRVAFVTALNTGTVKVAKDPEGEPVGREFSYITTHRLVLDGARVREGRRFWDQTQLFRPLAPHLPDLFAEIPAVPPAGPRTHDRLTAWNTRDSAALVAGVTGFTRLTGPGLTAPRTGRAQARAYLERFFSGAHGLSLRPGRTVTDGRVTYREWVGGARVGPPGHERRMTYGISERFTHADRGGVTWELSFDTLDMVATPAEIAELRKILFPPRTAP